MKKHNVNALAALALGLAVSPIQSLLATEGTQIVSAAVESTVCALEQGMQLKPVVDSAHPSSVL